MSKYKVIHAQYVSSMCLVCGQDNHLGLKGHFYDLENGDLYAALNPIPEHQSYPGRMHGGVASAIIDEVVGRVINNRPEVISGEEEPMFGVTMDLKTRFRKPTPYDQPLYCVAHTTKITKRIFEAVGYLYSADGTLCMEGSGRYMRLSQEQIMDQPMTEHDWHEDPLPVPEYVEIPTYPTFKK